ncbi:MAG: 3-methyl-2-oxobutanoate dehydrogenase subunit VorB [Elusimicrobia bacterium]|nr:3-methyl-2-oxobutanoate dehydrogenase subunit VorB [Elusimicrobiota bacterium]MBD3412269.1 3-methyl-2-oxobutanoate dehydrogenase subunit VorB [Elusimicrobiota bacterium]
MKTIMKGNEALCEGACAAGVDAYYGYPITPQNEVPAFMSRRLNEQGKVFIQAESEIAAINMVFGTAVAGKRAMTSSSSPGISLKQEGISYCAGVELPCLIVNITRGGPGLGNISGAQSDYFQATRGGGHGDYRTIVLAPDSVQEMYEHALRGFHLADKYRIPVLILSDGIIGQMMEPIDLNQVKRLIETLSKDMLSPKDWVLDGCKGRKPRMLCSLYMKEGALEQFNYHLLQKHKTIAASETLHEAYEVADQEYMIVAFGIAARVGKTAIRTLRKRGVKTGLFRPITLWPFPSDALFRQSRAIKKILVVELNNGQMIEDVRLAVNGTVPVEFFGKPGGGVITEEEIVEKIEEMYA